MKKKYFSFYCFCISRTWISQKLFFLISQPSTYISYISAFFVMGNSATTATQSCPMLNAAQCSKPPYSQQSNSKLSNVQQSCSKLSNAESFTLLNNCVSYTIVKYIPHITVFATAGFKLLIRIAPVVCYQKKRGEVDLLPNGKKKILLLRSILSMLAFTGTIFCMHVVIRHFTDFQFHSNIYCHLVLDYSHWEDELGLLSFVSS